LSHKWWVITYIIFKLIDLVCGQTMTIPCRYVLTRWRSKLNYLINLFNLWTLFRDNRILIMIMHRIIIHIFNDLVNINSVYGWLVLILTVFFIIFTWGWLFANLSGIFKGLVKIREHIVIDLDWTSISWAACHILLLSWILS